MNNSSVAACNGQSPCSLTIQAAINAAQPGDTICIQAGVYAEAVQIKDKRNPLIEADSAAPEGSELLGSASQACSKGAAVQIEASRTIMLICIQDDWILGCPSEPQAKQLKEHATLRFHLG